MTTKQFIKELLRRADKKGSPYLTIGAMDRETCELVCAANNLRLAIWQPGTRQIYVRTIDCERYVNS
jgi:hypothetical protein